MENIPLMESYALQQAGEYAASKLQLYVKAREMQRQQTKSPADQNIPVKLKEGN